MAKAILCIIAAVLLLCFALATMQPAQMNPRSEVMAREDNCAEAIRKRGYASTEAYKLAFKLCMSGQIRP
jgi:hypothetical protein